MPKRRSLFPGNSGSREERVAFSLVKIAADDWELEFVPKGPEKSVKIKKALDSRRGRASRKHIYSG